MRISSIPNMPDNFELVLFGDNQEGNIASAREKYRECIEYVCAGKNRYGVHMGDACDAFWVDDVKRYDPHTTKTTPIAQRKENVKLLTPLVKTGRLLTVLKGNHEHAVERKVGEYSEDFCELLRERGGKAYPLYGTYSHKLEFLDKKGSLMFKAYLTHGRKMISSVSPDPHRKRANMQYRLKLILEQLCGDAILMAQGHCHLVLVTPPIPTVYLTSDKGRLKQNYSHAGSGKVGAFIPGDYRWYGCTGSFLKTFVEGVDTYSEMAQYAPTELGYLIADIRDRTVANLREIKI